jgi:hypothetical protein
MPSSRRTLRELGYYDPPPRWPRLRLAFFSAMFGTILGAAAVIGLGSAPDPNADNGSRAATPRAETGGSVRAEATPDVTEGSSRSVPVTVNNAVPNGDAAKPSAKRDGAAEPGAAPAAIGITAPESSIAVTAPASQGPSAEAAPDHGTASHPSAGRKKPRKIAQTPTRSEADDDSSMRAERRDRWNGRSYTGYAGQDRWRDEAGDDGRWRDKRAERWDRRGYTGYAGYGGQDRRRGEADDGTPWRAERTDRWDGRAGYAGQDRWRSEAGEDGRWRDKRPRSGRGRASAGDDDEGRGGFGRDGADAREGSRGTRGLWFW